ncbi:MAG: tRNA (adenosine(37)-N6)-threonylcarbamoyltransferase complex transferase subunit TsaD [Candidatus Omnitrophica bacterium CG12_big_fil_rev_8_21_14_0_65_50_5]|nr:MAG: tRNA (adenosine(37)-N6)-threonylcarbamoyltransferase complex transferase subunit TsaD [Candidatus Omnitrophica bacterium CG12_big_fil_rev_8_21_14_0_65_50_5]
MKILGIETTCDETSAAVVENGRRVLSNVVVSSLKEHSKYGGVIPEIASRRQLECIQPVVEEALADAGMTLKNIGAVAVANHPGLIGSLLVGTSFASALSASIRKPLIEVNHVHAHLYANFLLMPDGDGSKEIPALPAVGLIVSGGHTSLYLIKDFKNPRLIGQTVDDAAGEAYDKVARILDLGYPGGPVIDELASQIPDTDLVFSCAPMKDSLNFSFSGIKTAALYHTQKHGKADRQKPQIAHAFQKSVVTVLVDKALEACRRHKAGTLLIGGGVAANSLLRAKLKETAETQGVRFHCPPPVLCLDNGAMIAGLAYRLKQ